MTPKGFYFVLIQLRNFKRVCNFKLYVLLTLIKEEEHIAFVLNEKLNLIFE